MTWRDKAAPIIARVLRETVGKTDEEIFDALRKAYPFGRRSHFPYKIWLDEIKAQRGTKKKKARTVEQVEDPKQCKFQF